MTGREKIDAAIEKYATTYNVDPRDLTLLEKQGNEGKFVFPTKKMNTTQLEKVLKVAIPEERPELEKIFDTKLENELKKKEVEAHPKSLAEKLHRSDVEDAIKLYRENEAGFNNTQKFEAKRRLREKVMNSNERRTLSAENYAAAKAILGNLPPHKSPSQKVKKPIRGLDSLKRSY